MAEFSVFPNRYSGVHRYHGVRRYRNVHFRIDSKIRELAGLQFVAIAVG
jgi:hypothetical protein